MKRDDMAKQRGCFGVVATGLMIVGIILFLWSPGPLADLSANGKIGFFLALMAAALAGAYFVSRREYHED